MEHIDYTPPLVTATTWQESAESLRQIRQTVFIIEQGVSAVDEWDEQDESAIHWLAYAGSDEPIGTARLLPGGQVGRMAVLADHRGRGIGSALLRNIIAYAREHGMGELLLNAQLKAIPLYERHGFVVCGDEFEDAGLPHRPMQMTLTTIRPGTLKASKGKPEPADTQPRHCASLAEQHHAALELLGSARREILLLSSRLLPEVFDHEDITSVVARCCLDSLQLEVLLLVRDIDYLARCHHRLIAQQQRIPSRISVKYLDPAIHTDCGEFLAVDQNGLLELYGEAGRLTRHTPRRAAELRRDFLELWRVASPDPNLRKLNI